MSSPLQSVRQGFGKALSFDEYELVAVDFCFSTVLAPFIADVTAPIWGWLIGPPGTGKGELLRPYEGHASTLFVSSPTPQFLASGYVTEDGSDPSLLLQLDGKVLIVKEFSAVLGMGETALRKIMGDLRDAYDGSFAKASGTRSHHTYRATFGFLSAATPKIETHMRQFQELGERMIAVRLNPRMMTRAARRARYRHIRQSMKDKAQWQRHLRDLTHQTLNELASQNLSIQDVTIPLDEDNHIIDLCDITARLRTHPHPGPPSPESATRLLQQIIAIGCIRILADARTTWTPSDTTFVRRILHDTLPSFLLQIIEYLYFHRTSQAISLKKLAQVLQIDAAVLAPYLYQYTKLGILRNERRGTGYRLTTDTLEQINESGYLADFTWRGTKTEE